MNENKKILIVLGFIVAIILTVIISSMTTVKMQKEVFEKFNGAFESDTPVLVYIGKTSCSYCQLLNPSITEMKERYNFDYIYVNTEKMSSYMDDIVAKLDITELGTPFLAVVSKDGIIDTQNGYTDYDLLFEFLQTNKIIAEDAKLPLNYIGLDEYKTLLNGSEPSIVVIGQSTCSHCISTKLVLNKIASENGTKINYLNVSYLSEEDGSELESSLDYFSGEWGTPATLIVKDGKLVASLSGERPEESFISFFTENGVLN